MLQPFVSVPIVRPLCSHQQLGLRLTKPPPVTPGRNCHGCRLCCHSQGVNIPLIVRKSDGGFGYASTDMAAVRHRVDTEKVTNAILSGITFDC